MGMLQYIPGALKLLAFQGDYLSDERLAGSAIFNENGKCVGMNFQSVEGKGVAVPVTLIKHFIEDYDKNGRYTGLPTLGVKWQKMENHDLRMYMRMPHDQEGVLIIHVEANYPELQVLKLNDVILSIDGVKISNDGTVPFMRGCRLDFNSLLTQKHTGDSALVQVLRDSKIHEFSIKLATHKQFVPGNVKGRAQSYYIIGGLMFTTLSIPLLRFYAIEEYQSIYNDMLSQALHEESIVLSRVLKSALTMDYNVRNIEDCQVLSLNDKPIRDMKELVSMVESCEEEYLKFILKNQQIVVLRTTTAKETTPEILKTYRIPSAISEDLKR